MAAAIVIGRAGRSVTTTSPTTSSCSCSRDPATTVDRHRPGEIGDRHRFAGAQAQDPAQMVLDVVVDDDDVVVSLADAVDDDMGRRTSQRIGADRSPPGSGPLGHENADLIREKIPSLG